jgi:formate hydrogenlyase transcriptional activator
MDKKIETIHAATMDAPYRYQWPGNIRELENVIERAVNISTGPTLQLDVEDLRVPKARHGDGKPFLSIQQFLVPSAIP